MYSYIFEYVDFSHHPLITYQTESNHSHTGLKGISEEWLKIIGWDIWTFLMQLRTWAQWWKTSLLNSARLTSHSFFESGIQLCCFPALRGHCYNNIIVLCSSMATTVSNLHSIFGKLPKCFGNLNPVLVCDVMSFVNRRSLIMVISVFMSYRCS